MKAKGVEMLYRPAPLDFSRSFLVFVHIPKTGGGTVAAVFDEALGADSHLFPRLEKIGKIHPSRLHKMVWETRKFLRNAIARAHGLDPLLPTGFAASQLNRLALLNGHFTLGAEPKTNRQSVYITLVRDPVDRFLSDYYYRFDIRAAWPSGKRERHAFWTYEIDRFVDYVYKRRSWTDTNLQCRYIGGRGDFAAAKDAVDNRVFLAAPLGRFDDFLELLQPVLPLQSTRAPRANVGKTRQDKAPPSRESLAKIREMVVEDQLLFDYVSKGFDDLYRRYAATALSA
jgi:hypothetical protein